MSNEDFIKELEKLDIYLSEKQLNQLEEYYKMVIDYNKHTNLTRITDKKEFYLKHYYDSLTIIKAIKLNNQSLLDVGTGAGFPGIVLKIVFPQLKITLIDSLNKRIIFLNEVINHLNLNNIKAIHTRAEDYIKENRESFDIVTSRAVANLQMLSELCIPFVKVNGYFIPMKAEATKEITDSTNAIDTLGAVIEKVYEFNLFSDTLKRTIIKIKKTRVTMNKFPRKFSEIKKKPL